MSTCLTIWLPNPQVLHLFTPNCWRVSLEDPDPRVQHTLPDNEKTLSNNIHPSNVRYTVRYPQIIHTYVSYVSYVNLELSSPSTSINNLGSTSININSTPFKWPENRKNCEKGTKSPSCSSPEDGIVAVSASSRPSPKTSACGSGMASGQQEFFHCGNTNMAGKAG